MSKTGGSNPPASRPQSVGISYEPALDGLRAIAVLGVMFYHAGLPFFRGGFLGVDLFFVLSGYLITTLLLVERRRTGSIDMKSFWRRRAKRLLPALFLMLVAVAAYNATAVAAEERRVLRDHGIATLFYVGNWWQIANGQSYFAQFANPSPLQHTWSLAIEEQWYLIFPLVFAGVLRLRSGRLSGLSAGLFGLAVVSAAWMAARFDPVDPSRVYFGTGTRLQDLLVGAALAASLAGRYGIATKAGDKSDGKRRAAATVRGTIALGLVLVTFIVVPDTQPLLYRSGFLVFSLVSALLLSVVMDPREKVLRAALSQRWLVAIGLISYGLYLWHWPVFVLLDPSRTGVSGAWLVVLRFVATFGVSMLSYRMIEHPVRSGVLARRFGAGGEVATLGLAVLVVAACTLAPAIGAPALPENTSVDVVRVTTAGHGIAMHFIGDSVALGLEQHFDSSRVGGGIELGVTARLGCGPLAEPLFVDGEPLPRDPECEKWATTWMEKVAKARPEVAVFFGGMGQLFDVEVNGAVLGFGTREHDDYLRRRYLSALAGLKRISPHVAVVNVSCNRVYDGGMNPVPRIANDDGRVAHLNGIIREVASNAGVPVIDIDSWLCGEGHDPAYRDGVKLRFDGLHYTDEGARLVWDWLAPQLLALVASPSQLDVDRGAPIVK